MSKRIKQTIKENPTGGIDVTLTCRECGKPIVKTNKFGMYCEDMCGHEADKKAYEKIKKMFEGLF